MKKVLLLSCALIVSITLISCNQSQPLSVDRNNQQFNEPLAKGSSGAIDMKNVQKIVEDINRRLELAGSEMRLDEAWFFTIGYGTDPYMRLRTGSRWPVDVVAYVLDTKDYTTDLSSAEVDAALSSSYETWNLIANSNLHSVRIPDRAGNFDIIDGTYDANGNLIDLVDITADNLLYYDPGTGAISFIPEAHIYMAGWVNPNYFIQGFGSPYILGVTWSFSLPDGNGDKYRDRVYVEQLYNPLFVWTNTDAVYLDFDAPIDIESVAAHENGHAHGLGHFGGPVLNQPYKLQPNGKVFNPEAIMNPFYLGGEKRLLLPTDAAAMRTMYAR